MRIGNITLEQGILLAPMEDVTDLPFRVICKRLGADLVYTEFVNSDGLVRGSAKTAEEDDLPRGRAACGHPDLWRRCGCHGRSSPDGGELSA